MHRPWPLKSIPAAGIRATALMLLAANAGAQYAVSESPPMSLTPPTNVVLMMDDSGSMQWSFVPDAYGACTGWRRFNAATFNGLAYDPTIVYKSPVIINDQGVPTTLWSCFSASLSSSAYPHCSGTGAWVDGFNQPKNQAANQAQVWIDLATGYQPTAASQPGSPNQTFSPHPIQDLTTIFNSSTPPAGAAAGGVGSNCGGAYAGNGGGGGGGNQFGPATGTNNAVGAPAYYYVYDSTQTSPTPCSTPNTLVTSPNAALNDDNCYSYRAVVSATVHATDVDQTPIDGLQNFANWYSFYRTRHLMIASAAAIGMADPVLQQTRVTWRALNSCTDMVSAISGNPNCAGWDGQVVDNAIRTFNDAPVKTGGMSQRTAFYHWLTHVPASAPTPTRSTWTYIGDYFSQGPNTAFSSNSLGANGPYGINPNPPAGTTASTSPTGATEVACVQNFNITLTDGQWNGDNNGTYFGTADTTSTPLPANAPQPAVPNPTYTPSASAPMAIYSNDQNRDTLSDIAFHYWATNLRPDLNGSATAVKPYWQFVTSGTAGVPALPADFWNPQNDPATWPHLVQMTIGIGMTGSMSVPGLPWWGNDVTTQYTQPGYLNLYKGGTTYPWPNIVNTATQGDIGKAYDLWHAAINSRGLAFSAGSAADLVTAIKSTLARVAVTLSSQSAVATNSSSLTSGTVAYLASFTSSDWHGTLSAYAVPTSGALNTATATPIWTTDPPGPPTAPFAPPGTRSIITSNPPTGAMPVSEAISSGTPFVWSSTSPIWTNVPTANANVVSWLRGDQSMEAPSGIYRHRPVSVLGDIVDSAPVFTLNEDFGYSALPEGMNASTNYLAFLKTVKNVGKGTIYSGAGMVYVGANDGMLHGFDAGTGQEVFAYVPRAVISNLPALTATGYVHQFYVDQTPYVGDVCIGPTSPASCIWSTVVVGTTGAGGQGVFALDVTSPKTMETAAGAAGKVLWDLDGQAALGAATNTDGNGDPDLGYTIGKPMVARLNDGTWAAIFGNGYLSKNGCAVLFIVRLDNGAVAKIGTSGTPGTTTCTAPNINASNGLGPVTLYDADGNMTTDYVYAGDLQGNLWKFDLHTAALVPTGNSSGGLKLFAAPSGCFAPAPPAPGTNTCQPITSAPALGPPLTGLTGTMVYFGTGRIFATGDTTTTAQQAFYAVLDQNVSVNVGSLVPQTFTESNGTRSVVASAVNPPSMGWYMNLSTGTGERITVSPVLVGGYVVFATEIPTATACTSGGTGWIMAVSATSNLVGGSNNSNFFAANQGVNGIQSTVGVIEGITVLSGPGGDNLLVGGTQGVQNVPTNAGPPKGRISWHELTR